MECFMFPSISVCFYFYGSNAFEVCKLLFSNLYVKRINQYKCRMPKWS
ncbi:hypothetical protein HMPREF1991_03055 [Hoylesella loescheii DSM 19665 = JCM 12249 = ATCC 15930]|uniref:Uncharacterized protein n=1 Tax=Hoylesella loescheii DSM 19665 = JCM 12249 = ATCC 15930 TaxID=1122985 RepID=A0A069QDA6_HOYLO|nr:hypothetical protein HMPREF1991_03055 [Hoylesella loescheii DSM 19665 = JCM 12249 = ATCC 15930]